MPINTFSLNELLPKINTEISPTISISKALQLFDILFKNNQEEISLYNDRQELISDYYVGDIILKESYHQESLPESKYTYINLPHHTILDKQHLTIHSFTQSDYLNIVYRCLFLKQDLDLYNINNHQFYNHHEDNFQSIINFQDYIKEFGINQPSEIISISKALALFKKTIK